jgi:AraC family transcriptional regulator
MDCGEPFEISYCGPLHLLIAHERLARRRGATRVEGLPSSSLQNLSQTLTFVPAEREFREWHDPDSPSRSTYVHIDPSAALMSAEKHIACETLAPRLHFQCAALWQTVLKLKALVEEGDAACSRYGEALGVVLAHELIRSSVEDGTGPAAVARGLLPWQRRLVAAHIEEHMAEPIPVARLAQLARLSPSYFCRSFRTSFGTPPHRYHSTRRVERAKLLLAGTGLSVTEIALDVGFSETSSFTAAFRRLVGCTPSSYRHSRASDMV